jgi:hypothetical protein
VDDVRFARDVGSGALRYRALATEPVRSNFSISPDGQSVAVTKFPPTTPGVFVVPASGGELNLISPAVKDWRVGAMGWSSDGRSLFVTRNNGEQSELWQVPLDGSGPRNTGIRSVRPSNGIPPGYTGLVNSQPISRISAHPDGRRLALSQIGRQFETWVLQGIPTAAGK